MQEYQYKTFSLKTHQSNWQKNNPNICQFELTFGCGLHCRHCYTDCYNKPSLLKKELKTNQVKALLDKIYSAGVIWMCFTGGDPLTRPDFLEIYDYAKQKGFIITLFTNGYSMTQKIVTYLAKKPPFVIELTLNAATKDVYDKITQVKGSFEKTLEGIDLMQRAGLEVKIKTQVTKDNLKELPRIKKYIQGLGLRFKPSVILQARLNGNRFPCELRLSPQEVLNFNGRRKQILADDCQAGFHQEDAGGLFNCAIGGGDGMHIDPCGNMIPCLCIREPKVSVIKEDVSLARDKLLDWIRVQRFHNGSLCKVCDVRSRCGRCPGKALLETGDKEAVIPYFCELAKAIL